MLFSIVKIFHEIAFVSGPFVRMYLESESEKKGGIVLQRKQVLTPTLFHLTEENLAR